MHEAFKIFVLSTIIVTLWNAFLLLQDKRGNRLLNRWFAAFLIALTMPQMDLYANQVVQGGIFKLALVASTFLWLKGPFIWVFIKVLTRQEWRVRQVGLHFLPWLCVLVTVLNFPQAAMTCTLLGMCHMLGYLLVSIWRLVKMRKYLADVWCGFQNSAYYWLLYVIGGVMTLVAVDFVVMSLVNTGYLNNYNLLDYVAFPGFSVYVVSVAFLSVYRPELLFRKAADEIGVATAKAAFDSDQLLPKGPEPKERHLELDMSIVQALTQQLTQLMQDQHMYRQNELSLPDLAERLGISVHQVSELLNVHCGLSFYDYVNGYRLQYACRLLADPNCHLRILDIAFEAGYNNKNSFYRAFKDNVGVTPASYRDTALAAGSEQVTRAIEV